MSNWKSVIGVDPSLSQISNAKKAENIQYKQSPAECIDQPPNTADLITVAQAVHWFGLPKFFEESKYTNVDLIKFMDRYFSEATDTVNATVLHSKKKQ
ncbi:hypothetical protein PPL_12153 [Heterostelium album PN500]|uniref:Methyltransferase type 11 domain-containing protein n=1 Tax=Heterostelium pallidum (strain ATCC 26659 / Pp 5 / PN500) TaxID=670386 RepID=D3BLU9_HETP5|nr:hypothetical protein PPL_12153 [Heterostelium album PN500]EFA77550.1 hypothetical protein PPL_12153 [Heterostelium album PN500]|eukprot:XP_020429678.1 hypothetical protein PPL_12153 [Heterostelium album PN500]